MEDYGVWQLKKMYGKESMGVVRSTFIIDPKGIIQKVWYKVRAKEHAEKVLTALGELQ
jgi:thioredoxin-dependent peroxiredoxin